MKLRKVLGLVIAIAMIGALAVTASADHGITFNAADGSWTVENIGLHANATRLGIVLAAEADSQLPAGVFHLFLPEEMEFSDIASVRVSFVPSIVDDEPVAIGHPELVEWGVAPRDNFGNFEQRPVSADGGVFAVEPAGEHFSLAVTNWAAAYPVAGTFQLLGHNGLVIRLSATTPSVERYFIPDCDGTGDNCPYDGCSVCEPPERCPDCDEFLTACTCVAETTPVNGEGTTPAPGDVTTPVSGGSVTTPVSGGSVTTPVSGGSVTTPVSGGATTPAATAAPKGGANPPTGVALALIPTLVAAGFAVVATKKRK